MNSESSGSGSGSGSGLSALVQARTAVENARRAVRSSRAETIELNIASLRVGEAIYAFEKLEAETGKSL